MYVLPIYLLFEKLLLIPVLHCKEYKIPSKIWVISIGIFNYV